MKKPLDDLHSPLIVFYCYANEDEALRGELEKHLSLLRRQGIIATWYDRQIVAGADWQQEIDAHLDLATIILLLISPDFLASDYCYGVEMQRALERHAQGEAYVIPIMLRPVDWQDAPFSSLQGLPCDLKAVTSWSNQDEAFLDIARGIRWTAKRLLGQTENDSRLLSADEQAASLLKPAAEAPSLHDLRNRQRFLAYLNVRYRDVFAQTLQGTALIPLSMHTAPDATEQLSQVVFWHLHQAEQAVPEGTSIVDLFQQSAGELLILGEPGAGKSTLLLQLAESLCQKAERDVQQQLPVILNLSSWAQKPRPLSMWLVEELFFSYQVPRTLGQLWVQQGQIIPLLDGLDEVRTALRGSCIDAINAYRRDYLVPIVVCSRTGDYLREQRRFIIQQAVVIQPLNDRQIDSYLAEPDSSLAGVRTLLQENAALHELAASPLMLNILAITYRNASVQALPEDGSPEEQQQQVFANYLKRMLPAEKGDQKSLLSPLSWLAQQLRQRNQSIFYLEQLQPDWLLNIDQTRVYELLAVRLPGIIIGALVSLIICSFLLFSDLPSFVMYALLGGVLGGVLSRGGNGYDLSQQKEKLHHPFWISFLLKIMISIVIGIIIGREFGLYFGIGAGLYSFLLQVCLRTTKSAPSSERPSREIILSFWRKLRRTLSNTMLYNSFFAALFAWLIFGLAEILPSLHIFPNLTNEKGCGGCGGVEVLEFLLMHHTFGSFGGLRGFGYAISFALVAAALSALLIGRDAGIQIADRLTWSWSSLIKSLLRIRHVTLSILISILVGLCFGLGVMVDSIINRYLSILSDAIQTHSSLSINYLSDMAVIAAGSSLSEVISFGISTGLGFGAGYWLLLGLFQGVASQTISHQSRTVPNEGIHRSFFNGLWSGLASAFIVGIICFICFYLDVVLSLIFFAISQGIPTYDANTVNNALSVLQNDALLTSLVLGLSAFGLSGLLMGGLASFRHYVLRFLLVRAGVFPWKLPALLEEYARHILLRKIGNGYTFIHQMFRDYIASLEDS